MSEYRKYIFQLLVLSIGLSVIFFFFSFKLVNNIIEPHDNLNKSLMLLNNTNAPVAAFGDSRMAFDYRPIGDVVNLGYMGESVFDMSARVQKWLGKNKAPSVAILEADPHLFSVYRSSPKEKSYFNSSKSGIISRFSPINERHYPLLLSYWARYLFGGGIKDSKFQFTSHGWQRNPENFASLSKSERIAWASGRVIQQVPARAFETSLIAQRYRSIVDQLLKSRVSVCLVTTPVSPAYYKLANTDPQFQAAIRYFRNYAANDNVRYVNLFDAFSAEGSDSLFADEDHLNEKGAILFSALVTRQCLTDHVRLDYGK